MSDETGFPTEAEIGELPVFSRVSYALRYAMRIQPLLTTWENPPNQYIELIAGLDKLMALFSINVMNIDLSKLCLQAAKNVSELIASIPFANTDIRSPAFTASQVVDTLIDIANCSVYYFPPSSSDLGIQIDLDFEYDKSITTQCVNAVRRAAQVAESAAMKTFDAHEAYTFNPSWPARHDYSRLKILEDEVLNASEAGPLGNLWNDSPTEWYIKAKVHYDKSIAEWERKLAEEEKDDLAKRIASSEPEPLISVYFDDSGFTNDEIAECLEYLSESYRSMGGIGLKVVNGNSLVPETEKVSQ